MKRGNWALWHLEQIRDLEGDVYLTRRRIVMTPWVSLYRHAIHTADFDRVLHDHPFRFLSLITSGGYIEEVASTPNEGCRFIDRRSIKVHARWSFNAMTKRKCHRISYVAPNTKTLVLVGPRKGGEDSWGFWLPNELERVPWRDYLRSIGHPQAGER